MGTGSEVRRQKERAEQSPGLPPRPQRLQKNVRAAVTHKSTLPSRHPPLSFAHRQPLDRGKRARAVSSLPPRALSMQPDYLPTPDSLPPSRAAERIASGRANWRERLARLDKDQQQPLRELTETPKGKHLLESLFGHSPFLAHCLLVEPLFLMELAAKSVDSCFARSSPPVAISWPIKRRLRSRRAAQSQTSRGSGHRPCRHQRTVATLAGNGGTIRACRCKSGRCPRSPPASRP